MHDAGAWVIGLRLPGHGTAPSGLVDATWQDMAAAVRLAMAHLAKNVGNRPIYLIGYSNGATLAIHYALNALDEPSLPKARGLVLLSPSLGVTPLAAYAVWQARIGNLIGLDKLAWNSILPEYDPFKYQSFAINAGDQVYRLITEIQRMLKAAGSAGHLDRFPPVLAFQSVADGTVSAEAVISGLFAQLPENGHELVLFDINRSSEVVPLLSHDPMVPILRWLNRSDNAFTLNLVSNVNSHSQRVIVQRKDPGSTAITDIEIGFDWPRDAYSLSHVALPFAADDPLYGPSDSVKSPGLRLGSLALRGERGVLRIPASDQLRLRWNPFYPYMEKRLMAFIRLWSVE
jgi:pimeloyl-ACP methyl ester carboxylesterase